MSMQLAQCLSHQLDPWPRAYTSVGFIRVTVLGFQLVDLHSCTPVFMVDTIHTRMALSVLGLISPWEIGPPPCAVDFHRRDLCPFHKLTRLTYWTMPWWGSLNARLGEWCRKLVVVCCSKPPLFITLTINHAGSYNSLHWFDLLGS